MVNDVVYALIFNEMSVVVSPAKSGDPVGVLSRIIEIGSSAFPAIRVERGLGGHIRHAARGRNVDPLVLLPADLVILPVGAVCIVIYPVDIVQLARFKKVGSVNGNKFAVKGQHILSQPCYLRDLAVHSVAVCRCASAEGEPAYAIFVNAHARVKGRGAILQPRHILINQRLAERIGPRSHRVGGGNNSHTVAAV